MPEITASHETRIMALEAQFRQKLAALNSSTGNTTVTNTGLWNWLPAIVTVDSGTGAVAWTTYDASADIPETATEIMLMVQVEDSTGGPNHTYFNYRKDSTATEYQIGFLYAGTGDNVGQQTNSIVPISQSTFDYEVDAGSNPDWLINLLAYR